MPITARTPPSTKINTTGAPGAATASTVATTRRTPVRVRAYAAEYRPVTSPSTTPATIKGRVTRATTASVTRTSGGHQRYDRAHPPCHSYRVHAGLTAIFFV